MFRKSLSKLLCSRSLIPFAVVGLLLTSASAALAHPLGNFTINHYSRLEVSSNELRVRYVLDYAEIPTFQEKQQIDKNGDGVIGEDERAKYLAKQMVALAPNLHLRAGEQDLNLQVVPNSAQLEFQPGQGGLEIMRLSAWFRAPLELTADGLALEYRDDNYSERLGWREIVATGLSGAMLKQSSVPSKDITNELRAYPQDMLTSPLNVRSAELTVAAGEAEDGSATLVSSQVAAFAPLDRTQEDFAKLIATKQDLSPSLILVSLLAAAALGAIHSFSPGHGKAIVGAYLIGSRGTPRHALYLGLIVTATHTAGVFALGLITLFASRYILPEQLYPWLGVISGVLVATIGIRSFMSRFGGWRAGRPAYPFANFDTATTAELEANSHSHDGIHFHSHASTIEEEDHGHGNTSEGQNPSGHDHNFLTEQEELEHARCHIPAVMIGASLKWQSLVSLGVSGGLLPCPSALVVMLSAIALGRVGFGLILIVAFSIGLASVLTLTGVSLLYAGKYATRLFSGGRSGWFLRVVPIFSAVIVSLLGLGIAAEAFMQTGLVK